jgi:hypothetical protein
MGGGGNGAAPVLNLARRGRGEGGQRWMPHNEWRGGGAGTWSSSGPHGRGSRGPTAAGARA